MEKRYKVKLNSIEKVEELLQEIYDQACRQLNEVQSEINKLQTSTNLGEDGFSMDDKAKYAKSMHDYMGDKEKAIKSKFEIAKFMGELIKHSGDLNGTLNDKEFGKATKLDLRGLREGIEDTLNNNGDNSTTYFLKK